jgi:tetratricopeptide (TPR) repeat protein
MTNNSEDDTHHTRSPNEYDKTLAIDPNNVDALYEKGVALSKLGLSSWEEAMKCYDKALTIDPNHVQP